MRHRVAHRKLGRTTPHRTALLRNLAASLIAKERIRTTVAKAKELRPFVEKLVTLGKKDSLHARRRALSILPRKEAVKKLFVSISPRFSERPGGYTRILKLAPRQGDGASMALIEFVDYRFETADSGPAAEKSAKKKKADQPKEAKTASETDADRDEAGEEKPAKKKRQPRKKASATA
ncbi:MAG TPA: 50S ribosomal protein L17 [Vicinamibacteria bacterium]|nr:50S ribosomal protein L17 [Vicinamibacteria bacterium]